MSLLVFIVACVSILVLVVAYVTVVPWIGHVVVKVITFGKVELGWRPSDLEADVAQIIGFIVLLFVAGLIAALLHK